MALKASVIGCGFIGSAGEPDGIVISHAGAYKSHPETLLTAGADINEDRLKEFSKKWGVDNIYIDYRELLEREAPQIVSICVPEELHFDVARSTIISGVKYVFLEKPVTETLKQADELTSLAKEHGTTVAVNYIRAWDIGCMEMVKVLKYGELGKIRTVNGYFTGGVVNNGSHLIQLLNSILGQPLSVSVADDTGDNFTATIEYAYSKKALLTSYDESLYSLHELDIIAGQGRYKMLSGGERIELWRAEESKTFPGYNVLVRSKVIDNQVLKGAFNAAVSDILSCRSKGEEPECGLVEARRALEVALAVERSRKLSGDKINLPLMDDEDE